MHCVCNLCPDSGADNSHRDAQDLNESLVLESSLHINTVTNASVDVSTIKWKRGNSTKALLLFSENKKIFFSVVCVIL